MGFSMLASRWHKYYVTLGAVLAVAIGTNVLENYRDEKYRSSVRFKTKLFPGERDLGPNNKYW